MNRLKTHFGSCRGGQFLVFAWVPEPHRDGKTGKGVHPLSHRGWRFDI
jgi:hypothetical protein